MQSIAEVIIKNTSNANERQDFWEKAELNLLMALMHYVATQTIPGTTELLPIQQRSLGANYRMLSNESFGELARRIEELWYFQAGQPADLGQHRHWIGQPPVCVPKPFGGQNHLLQRDRPDASRAKALRLLLLYLRAGLLSGVFELPVLFPALRPSH